MPKIFWPKCDPKLSGARRKRRALIEVLICMGLATHVCWATGHLEASPESTVWLEGDSTLHPFTSRTTQLQASGTLAESSLDAVLTRSALKTFDVVIPVTSLKSKESALDKNMYKALKAESCPDISFHLSHYVVSKDSTSAELFHAQVNGTLTVACQERPVTFETTLTPHLEALHVQGQYSLLMTDYGVKPPTMMMGTIKTKNAVIIHFDLQLMEANGNE